MIKAENPDDFQAQEPLRVKVCKPIAGLKFTCPHTEVNYHPVSVGMMCGQHASPPAIFGLYTLELP